MIEIVWFKCDLRVHDHAPLAAAAQTGRPVLPLYILEPGLWALPEAAGRHYAFLAECLSDLDESLRRRGAGLVVRVGEAVAVLSALHRAHGVAAIRAHEETGLLWTYARDRAVARWAKRAGVAFLEYPQFGVVRRLPNRDGWVRRWDRFMAAPAAPAPETLAFAALPSDSLPEPAALGLAPDPCPQRQPGGRRQGALCLQDFLQTRATSYRRGMSTPLEGAQVCSRISAHLAFGCLSMREAAQAAHRALARRRAAGDEAGVQGLQAFIARLHWHCHFIQKLEDAPDLELRTLHPAYEGLRPARPEDEALLAAWADGRTGFPFLDACMRSLRATGWLNFRMRAMVMAFASYHLWLDWRRPAVRLAQLFTDFEPGIHYPQAQMQSGVTGVNTARIYNPVKQSIDQDPEGHFIRRWAPELAGLPTAFLHEPWRAPEEVLAAAGVRLGPTYPTPLVDHLAAAARARAQIYAVRQGEAFRADAAAIQAKHGSRRSGLPQTGARRPKRARKPDQPGFDFG